MSVSSALNLTDRAARPGAIWFTAIAWCLAMLGHAHAQPATCTPVIQESPASVQIDYDPFVAGRAPTRLALQLLNKTEARCTIDLAITNPAGEPVTDLSMTEIGLVLTLRSSAGQVQSTETPGLYEVVLEAGLAKDISFDISVLTDAVVPAGHYQRPLFLSLRRPGEKVAVRSAPFQLALNALPRAQMNLSGARGSFGTGPAISIVDFGKAETGKVRDLFIQTRTNAPSRLTFNSANHGRLVLEGDESKAISLPYRVLFDGSPLDLASMAIRDIDPPKTYAGTSYPLVLQLGDIAGSRAGHYTDELTIEITTL